MEYQDSDLGGLAPGPTVLAAVGCRASGQMPLWACRLWCLPQPEGVVLCYNERQWSYISRENF